MKIRNEFLLINGLVLILILDNLILGTSIKKIVSIPILLFLTGYCIVSFVAPKKDDLTWLERALLSSGLSIVFFPLVLFFLRYTPFKIQSIPSLTLISLFILLLSYGSLTRRKNVPKIERFQIDINFPSLKENRVINFSVIILGVLAVFSLGYVVASQKPGEAFTEFYSLGYYNKTDYYLKEIVKGEEKWITVGVKNREGRRNYYRIETRGDGKKISDDRYFLLDENEGVEKLINFRLNDPGYQQLEMFLFRNDEEVPLSSLYLWLNVRDKNDSFLEVYVDLDPSHAFFNENVTAKMTIINHKGETLYLLPKIHTSWNMTLDMVNKPIKVEDGELVSIEKNFTLEGFDPQQVQWAFFGIRSYPSTNRIHEEKIFFFARLRSVEEVLY